MSPILMKVGVVRMPGRPLLALRAAVSSTSMRYIPLGSMWIRHIPKYSKFKEANTSKMAGGRLRRFQPKARPLRTESRVIEALSWKRCEGGIALEGPEPQRPARISTQWIQAV